MDDKQSRREAAKAYKELPDVGGVFRIVNTATGWQGPLQATPNLKGEHSKLSFSKRVNQWLDGVPKNQGSPADYALVELERLTRKPEQDTKAFREDIKALLELWQEKEGAQNERA